MKIKAKAVRQFQATERSFQAILSLGINHNQWRPGEMGTNNFYLQTPHGEVQVFKGDWVIKGLDGELLSCKRDIFENLDVEIVED